MVNKKIIIMKKIDELKYLLIGESLNDQKEIIIKFLFKNREISRHINKMYKKVKGLFERNLLNDFMIQEFINKTFIDFEEMKFEDYDDLITK